MKSINLPSFIKIFLRYSFVGKLILYVKYKCDSICQGSHSHVMFGSVVNKSKLGVWASVFSNCNISHSSIGNFSYIASGASIGRTSIGKFCCIGPNFLTGLGIHPTRKFVSSHPSFYSDSPATGMAFCDDVDLVTEKLDVKIGNDVWIGANVVVLDGVTIGDGAIIGAGSVVNKNIPPYAIAVGVPCKIIRFRFSSDEIELLLSQKWWDWSIEKLKGNNKSFQDIEKFKSQFFKQEL